jgi:hypothetical protein
MRFWYVLFAAAILLSEVAMAKLRLSNDEFGRAEAMFDFCARADSTSAAKYQERKDALVRGAQEKEIAEARKTQEYRTGYGKMNVDLSGLSEDQARASCAAILRADKAPKVNVP